MTISMPGYLKKSKYLRQHTASLDFTRSSELLSAKEYENWLKDINAWIGE